MAVNAISVFDALGAFTVREKDRIARIETVIGRFTHQSSTEGARRHGAFGLHVVTDDAMAAAAVPDPIGDEDSAWYWHEEFNAESVGGESITSRWQTRTKRVLASSKMTLMFAAQVSSASDSAIIYSVNMRVLFTWK